MNITKQKQAHRCRKVQLLSHVQVFAIPWTVAHQAPLSMGFSRQEYWRGLPYPSPGDLPNLGIEPGLLHCRKILYSLSYKGSPYVLIRQTHSAISFRDNDSATNRKHLLLTLSNRSLKWVCQVTYRCFSKVNITVPQDPRLAESVEQL